MHTNIKPNIKLNRKPKSIANKNIKPNSKPKSIANYNNLHSLEDLVAQFDRNLA